MPAHSRVRPAPIAPGLFTSLLIGFSLIAIAAAFVIADSIKDYETKSKGFAATIITFLIASFVLHYWNIRRIAASRADSDARFSDEIIEEKLFVIEEAGEYFSGSVRSSDVFRLIADKIGQIVPFSSAVLKMVDRASGDLHIVHTAGEGSERVDGVEARVGSGASGRCLATGMVQIERGIVEDVLMASADTSAAFRSSVAIPLIKSGEVFAIIQLFSDTKTAFDACPINVFEAIGERASSLVFSSLSFEQSITNALTDTVTELPNERAFHLLLENQIAETQRDPEKRPLSVIAIDVRDFDGINQKYGHTTGDLLLGLVAGVIKGELRQMDVVSRSEDDEFLVMLPTATESMAYEIIQRIEAGIQRARFTVVEGGAFQPELNFGVAAFGADGESPEPLILASRVRKQQGKNNAPKQVLWFPRDLVG